jgi:hypothetical protein
LLGISTLNLVQSLAGQVYQMLPRATKWARLGRRGISGRNSPQPFHGSGLPELAQLPDDHFVAVDPDGILRSRLLSHPGEQTEQVLANLFRIG